MHTNWCVQNKNGNRDVKLFECDFLLVQGFVKLTLATLLLPPYKSIRFRDESQKLWPNLSTYYVLTTPLRSTFTEHAMTFKIQDIKKTSEVWKAKFTTNKSV